MFHLLTNWRYLTYESRDAILNSDWEYMLLPEKKFQD